MEIKILRPGDEAVLARVAPDVFDGELDPKASAEFLRDQRHHIAVAIDEGTVVGFASGIHYFHPDKPRPELFVNELGVSLSYRRRGVATAVLRALLRVGKHLGCAQAWVLTEATNGAAAGFYASLPEADREKDPLMFGFELDHDESE